MAESTRRRTSSKAEDKATPEDPPVADALPATPETDPTPEPEPAETPEPVEAKDAPADEDSGHRYLNTSGGPLPYDERGHIVAAGDWTPAVNLDATGRHYRDKGYLQSATALGLT